MSASPTASSVRQNAAMRARFTLIELIMVVGIIAILMSLLLPALHKAKEKSRQMVCLNNYKNLNLAIVNYTQDYNDWMPYCWDGPASEGAAGYPQPYWPAKLYPYITNTDNYRGVFVCPSTEHVNYTYVDHGRPYCTNYAYYNLGNNRWGEEFYRPRKISRCQSPSQVAIMIDGKWFFSYADVWSVAGTGSLIAYTDLRHENGVNSLFVDGHAIRDDILHRDDMYAHLTYCVTCTCGSHSNRGLLWE